MVRPGRLSARGLRQGPPPRQTGKPAGMGSGPGSPATRSQGHHRWSWRASEEEKMEQPASAPPPDGSFGALLRTLRHRACLSQEQLAARAELSERTVRNLEADRVRSPRTDTVRLLADALALTGPERQSWVAAAQGTNRRQVAAGPPRCRQPGAAGPVRDRCRPHRGRSARLPPGDYLPDRRDGPDRPGRALRTPRPTPAPTAQIQAASDYRPSVSSQRACLPTISVGLMAARTLAFPPQC
jgi:DNA-binding XRE family transcriptional regulator